MEYRGYILNLIDTPGHVDFGYEVNRSLAACEGALLVVDATQGVQAQTLSNYHKAQGLNLKIIPVINKIDLPAADVEKTMLELIETFGFHEDDIISVSAKTGQNVAAILDRVIAVVPPPISNLPTDSSGWRELRASPESSRRQARREKISSQDPRLKNEDLDGSTLRALIVTAKFDRHKGAVAYIRVVDGQLSARDQLAFVNNRKTFSPIEIGFFTPEMTPTEVIKTGEVGYLCTGLKDIRQLHIGDTITLAGQLDKISPLPGYKEPKPVVYMELYPVDADNFPELADAVLKLSYHDAALQFANTHSTALGSGLRCGFLGILHAEIVLERLQKEYDIDLIATAPTVDYEVFLRSDPTNPIHVHSPISLPDPSLISAIKEPMAIVAIFTPEKYTADIVQFCRHRRGELVANEYVAGNIQLTIHLPLSELITDFHDQLKALSSGFASMEYELGPYQPVDAVRVNILLNGEVIEALSFITTADRVDQQARAMVTKLKEIVPRQMFEIPVQAAIGGKIIARETIKAFRKDVTAILYGGDVTRRQKLLKKQAKGKKRMKQFGKVELDQDVFLSLLRK